VSPIAVSASLSFDPEATFGPIPSGLGSLLYYPLDSEGQRTEAAVGAVTFVDDGASLAPGRSVTAELRLLEDSDAVRLLPGARVAVWLGQVIGEGTILGQSEVVGSGSLTE